MGESFGVAAFRSRQQVMRMNELFHREGLNTSIVTTPRDISAGCGLSVKFDMNDADAVRRVVTRARPANMIGIYRVNATQGQRMSIMPMPAR